MQASPYDKRLQVIGVDAVVLFAKHAIRALLRLCFTSLFVFTLNTHAGPLDLDWTLNPCSHPDPDVCGNNVGTHLGQLRPDANSLQGFQQSQFNYNGKAYRHMILDFPTGFDTGFRQEVIIEGDGTTNGDGAVMTRSAGRIASDVAGPTGCGSSPLSPELAATGECGVAKMGNGEDPLAIIYKYNVDVTGTGTTHPKHVILRQILDDSEFSQEFLKDNFDKKPTITETLTNSEIDSNVVIDMSSLDYDQLNTAAPMINTFSITDSLSGTAGGNFDMATDVQNSNVTAGKFIFVGGGPEMHALEGVYFYIEEGDYNVWNESGAEYRSDTQNGGPWADGVIYPEVPGWGELQ